MLLAAIAKMNYFLQAKLGPNCHFSQGVITPCFRLVDQNKIKLSSGWTNWAQTKVFIILIIGHYIISLLPNVQYKPFLLFLVIMYVKWWQNGDVL